MKNCIGIFLVQSVLSVCVAGPVVDELLHRYDGINTMSCSIRRETTSDELSVRMLSRVFYQRPDHLHVQNYSPVKRRYVADGERMYYHIDGMEKGFSRPISELNTDWLISLRALPGTPMDQLLRLKGCEEQSLDPTPEFPVRTACSTDKAYVILSQNEQGDLVCIDFYSTPDFGKKIAQYTYSEFGDYGNGIRLSTQRCGRLYTGPAPSEEVFRMNNITVNQDIPANLFVAEPFFKDVIFEDRFENIMQ